MTQRKRRTSAPKPRSKQPRRTRAEPAPPVPEADGDDDVPGSLFFESDTAPAADEAEGAVDDAAGMDREEDVVAEPAETGSRRR